MPHIIADVFGPRARRDFLRLALGVFSLLVVCAVCSAAKKTPPAEPVDLNVATVKELEDLPGVGPTTAKAIVDFRTKSGRIRRVNDLLVIRGISEAKLAKIRPYVTVGPPPAKATNAAKPTSAPAKTTTPSKTTASPAKPGSSSSKTTVPTPKTTTPASKTTAPAAQPTPPPSNTTPPTSSAPPSSTPDPAATATPNQ